MIPKGGGKVRSLGIPTVADRVVQSSLKLVLEAIFEADFKPCSYGFRPKRRAQDAIAEIHYLGSPNRNYHWVFEADIKACFDEIDHTALLGRVRDRVGDKRVLGLVKAFLKAGVLTEDGSRRATITGTPQGGILLPLLANIALSILDEHFTQKWENLGPEWTRVKRRRAGEPVMKLVRYADDFVVMVHGTREDAEALWDEVAAALAPMGLRLPLEEVIGFDRGQGAAVDPPSTTSNARRSAAPAQPGAAGLVHLLPSRSVETDLRLHRSLRVLARCRVAEETTPRTEHAHPGSSPPPRLGDQRQRDRNVQAQPVRRRALPIPGHQNPDTMDKRNHRTNRTSGMNTWRAGCSESCTSGSEGGPQKPTSRNADRALRSDPYTYVPTWSGFGYLATVLDVFSRRIVGWSYATHMRTELIIDAIDMAIETGRPPRGLIHHSNQGAQYGAIDFGRRCRRAGIVLSMGSVGYCYDNSMTESFFATLECELFDQTRFRNHTDARTEIMSFIDWYNHRRRHTRLDNQSPVHYELHHQPAAHAA